MHARGSSFPPPRARMENCARARPPGVLFVSRGIVCVIRWFVRARQGICKQKSKRGTGGSRG